MDRLDSQCSVWPRNGHSTYFWSSNWSSAGAVQNWLFGPLTTQARRLTIAECWEGVDDQREDLIRHLLDDSIKQKFGSLTVQPSSSCSDVLAWKQAENGEPFIKAIYDHISREVVGPQMRRFLIMAIEAPLSPTMKFLWSLLANGLPI